MKKYTEEQKRSAVQMMMELGPHKTREVLGIHTNSLYRWKRQLEDNLPDDDGSEVPEDCNVEKAVVQEPAGLEENVAAEEQPRKPATMPEIEAVISKYFMDCLENRPEIFVNSIIMAVKNIFKENEALARENAKLRRTLRMMLEDAE